MKKFTIALMALMAIATGCRRDDTLLHGDITMGNVVSGNILTDQGLEYHVAEQLCEGRIDTMNRVLIACDILRKTGDKEYDVRLTSLVEPLYKQAMNLSEAAAVQMGQDPVDIRACWGASGYVNMEFRMYVLPHSRTPHSLNLVLNESVNNADTLHFVLTHDASGEYFGAQGLSADDLVSKNGYASFYVSPFLPADRASVPAVILTRWHSVSGSSYLENTEEYRYRMTLTR